MIYTFIGGSSLLPTPYTDDFVSLTGLADGTIIGALEDFERTMTAGGLLDYSAPATKKFRAIWPFVGGTAAMHKWNFLDPQDTAAAYRLQFFNAWTHDANGAKGDGSTAWCRIPLNANVIFSGIGSMHFSQYGNLSLTEALVRTGIFQGGGNPCMGIGVQAGSNSVFDSWDYTTNRISVATADSLGLFTISRTATNIFKAFKRNVQFGATNTATYVGALPNGYPYLGAANISAGTSDNPLWHSAQRLGYSSIGDGLSDAEAVIHADAVQQLQVDLGFARAV